mgnify:FL=1
MRRDYHNWYSHRLNRQMELLAYGDGGLPILVFPTSMGRFFEFEDRGMIHQIWQRIEAGQLQVICVDSDDNESWYNHSAPPYDRVLRHIAYEEYILREVLPFIQGVNPSRELCLTGCSFGAYHAMNFTLKHPDIATRCVAMSGSFDIRPFLGGYYDNNCYFNNPVDYLPGLTDPWFLDRYQAIQFVLAAGDHDICLDETRRMAQLMAGKGIPHLLDIWGGGEKHD